MTVVKKTATITAGLEHVDVPHGLDGTPDTLDITLTAQGNLLGFSLWPSDIGPVTFRVNVGSAFMVDQLITCLIITDIPLTPVIGTTYSSVAQVKAILLIDEATWDTEIGNCITSGDALIDGILAKYTLTVPAPTPQNVVDASAYFAAWIYRRARDPVGAKAFEEEANRFLDIYVKAVGAVSSTIPFRSGEADAT